MKEERV